MSVMRVRKRGIVLISILFLTLLATFFLGALIQLNPSRLQRTVHDEARDQAEMAARAGIDYALTQFKSDLNWRADANGVVVDSDDLVILEDHGNLLGWMRTSSRAWSGFRIRFNHQDGSGGSDTREDPTYPIVSDALSLNNLSSSDPTDTPGERSLHVPGSSLALVAEGLVRDDLDPQHPQTLASATDGKMTTVEGLYVISDVAEGQDVNSVLMTGGDSEFTVGDLPPSDPTTPERGIRGVLSIQADSENSASLRSKGEVRLARGQTQGGGYLFDPDQDAEVKFGSGTFDPLTRPGVTYSRQAEGAEDPFLEIAWDKVAQSKQSDPIEIPAGVYIFSGGNLDSGRSVSNNVKYYAMTWPEYRQAKVNGTPLTESPLPAAFADRIQLDAKDVTVTSGSGASQVTNSEKRDLITFEKDVQVTPVGNLKDLTIIPERGARQMAGSDGSAGGEPIPVSELPLTDPAVLSAGEDFYLRLNLMTTITPTPGAFVMTIDGQEYPTTDGTVPAAARIPLLTKVLTGGTVTVTQSQAFSITPSEQSSSGITAVYANTMGLGEVEVTFENPSTFLGGNYPALITPGTEGSTDDRVIPKDPNAIVPADETVPQDVELVFAPEDNAGSSFVRAEGDVYLGTHISGEGGGLVAGGNLDIIGLGIDLHARADSSERDGVALYARKNINISTYDERRNKYWDVDVMGAIFTYGNLKARLGEALLPSGQDNPNWGVFNYEGSIISLGSANASQGGDLDFYDPDQGDNGTEGTEGTDGTENLEEVSGLQVTNLEGHTTMIASGIRLFFDPRYLAPYLENTTLNPTFTPLSVVVR